MHISPNLAIFVPSLDYCDYAITPNHQHPGYSFVYNFDGEAKIRVKGIDKSSPFKKQSNICSFSPDIEHEEIMEDQFKSYFAICIDKTFFESELNKYARITQKTFEGDFFPANEGILHALKGL